MRRLILVPVLIFLALAAIGAGIAYWIYDNYTFYRTDDAQLTSQIINVSAPAAGTLTTLDVKLGDTVTAGQTIGTITGAPTASASGKTGSSTSVDITSPMNGTIIQVPTVQGQGVAPGLPIATVTNLNTITVTAYVDESAINNIQVGQSVDIKIDAYSDTNFTGHVQQIVKATAGQFSLLPNQDPTSSNFTKVGQRIPVIITLDGNGGKQLLPGMSVTATVHIH
ncbi:MAG: HlyD family efflux transporter periplasmic adaptor subunit [Chloroflexi bacterium]|nr:MAG: HlyD family efflux transporter periplasmic adaptor subunit [Chloroflexota bacterium]